MTYLAIPGDLAGRLRDELLSATPLEAGTFCLLHGLVRGDETRLVLGEPIPSDEPWVAQEHDLLTPSGRRISAAVSLASERRCGLAFVHSHPNTDPAWLSAIDVKTTKRLGETLAELVDGPFASLVASRQAWAGVRAAGTDLVEINRIAVVGRGLRLAGGSLQATDPTLDDRQIRALGKETQRELRSLRVGVIGAGGIGSPVAETLVRMGVGEIRLVDTDSLDTVSNARRIFGVTRADTEADPPLPKALVVANALNRLDLGSRVVPVVGDVLDPEVQASLLDADVIVCGTDTHSSRAALTELAVRGAVPLVDVGVRVGIRDGSQLDALRLERRIQVPGGPCLWCWKTINAEQVRLELMPDFEREHLVQEGYVTGQEDGPAASLATLTVSAAGLATSAVLGLLSGALDVAPLGCGLDALTLESAPLSRQVRDPECLCSRWHPGSN